MRTTVHPYLLLAFLGLAGCGPHVDRAAERQALQRRDTQWASLAAAGKDVEKTASYWSDDAVIIPEGQPVVAGKAAIKRYVAQSFATPGFRIAWTSEPPSFSSDGRMAYMRGVNTISVPDGHGGATNVRGRALTVWRLEADGQWRCVLDMWNDAPATR